MPKKSEYIPTKKKTVQVDLEKPANTSKIPKDLQDQLGAIEACATAFNVLDKGYFPHNYAQAVKASLQFLQKLHEQSVQHALLHPDAALVPELKEALDKKDENGKTAEKQ